MPCSPLSRPSSLRREDLLALAVTAALGTPSPEPLPLPPQWGGPTLCPDMSLAPPPRTLRHPIGLEERREGKAPHSLLNGEKLAAQPFLLVRVRAHLSSAPIRCSASQLRSATPPPAVTSSRSEHVPTAEPLESNWRPPPHSAVRIHPICPQATNRNLPLLSITNLCPTFPQRGEVQALCCARGGERRSCGCCCRRFQYLGERLQESKVGGRRCSCLDPQLPSASLPRSSPLLPCPSPRQAHAPPGTVRKSLLRVSGRTRRLSPLTTFPHPPAGAEGVRSPGGTATAQAR